MRKNLVIVGIIVCIAIALIAMVCASPVGAASDITYTVTASALNVRSQPTTASSVLGLVYRGGTVRGNESSGGWAQIEYNGKTAYVYSQYLTKQSNNMGQTGSMTYIGTYRITGYDVCYSCCGKVDGITASGTKATVGRTIGMKGYPYGTKVYIEGIGYRTVEDTGNFSSNTIDVLCNNHSECYAITGYRNVYLVQ